MALDGIEHFWMAAAILLDFQLGLLQCGKLGLTAKFDPACVDYVVLKDGRVVLPGSEYF